VQVSTTEGAVMTETTNKVPVKTEKTPASSQARRPLERLRREIGSLYEDFLGGRQPSRRSFMDLSRRAKAAFGSIPVVHFTETERAYEITSELPGGMGEKMSR
jgi:HSP20 family protein